MSLKPAICTQCGGQIEVDDSKEAGICQFCGTAFITEKVINQYVTQNNFAGATINIQGGVDDENLYILARRAVQQNNTDDVLKYYGQLRERHPNDWEANFYSAFFKNDDSIVLPNIELSLSLMFDNVEITKDNLPTYIDKVESIYSLYLKKHGGDVGKQVNGITVLGTKPLLISFEKILDYQIHLNNNTINWNVLPIFHAIWAIDGDDKYWSWHIFSRKSLKKLLELDFNKSLSEEDKNSIKEFLLKYFDWFMAAYYRFNLNEFDELIEACPYRDHKEQKLITYKKIYENFHKKPLPEEYEKELVSRIKVLESELTPGATNFAKEYKEHKKKQAAEKRLEKMGSISGYLFAALMIIIALWFILPQIGLDFPTYIKDLINEFIEY